MNAGRQDQNESVKIRGICVSTRGRLGDSRPYLAPENFRVSAASREKNAAVKTKRTRRLVPPVLRLVCRGGTSQRVRK